PAQLSGGEKQRVAIARAFASQPDVLLLDEATSGLDVSVQANILNLLNELQAQNGSTALFISHDLAVVSYLADVIAVMYLGRVMEIGHRDDVLAPPQHPYTEALLSSNPTIEVGARRERIRLEGDVPSPVDIPMGCPFHTRCPRFLGDICVREAPPWRADTNGHAIYCHIPLDELKRSQAKT
ncbi:MAG: ABC transporter ATP-binding protein, partial [Chloroflexi bacterium]|nr:ABC transporter ATP-binding protein [Chloroflexota bacterium]